MAWTAPTTRSTGELITASIWNTDIVDNLVVLKDPETQSYILNEGADYTTTSTSFVDIDAGTGANTKLRLDPTTQGGDLIVHFEGTFYQASAITGIDLLVDGSRLGGDDGLLVAYHGLRVPTALTRLLTGLAATTHTIKMQWKVVSGTATLYAGAGTGNYDCHPQFWTREIS
jgi:hypothetical protein